MHSNGTKACQMVAYILLDIFILYFMRDIKNMILPCCWSNTIAHIFKKLLSVWKVFMNIISSWMKRY